jgi:hypothetical protein
MIKMYAGTRERGDMGRPENLDYVEIREDDFDRERGGVSVWTWWTGVDRPCTSGVAVKNRALALRLVAAIEAGVAVTNEGINKDNSGRTYVNTRNHFLSRMLNADLRRMGF